MESLLEPLLILLGLLNSRQYLPTTLGTSERTNLGIQANGNYQGRNKTTPEITRQISSGNAKRHNRKKRDNIPELHSLWRAGIMADRVILPLSIF